MGQSWDMSGRGDPYDAQNSSSWELDLITYLIFFLLEQFSTLSLSVFLLLSGPCPLGCSILFTFILSSDTCLAITVSFAYHFSITQ